MQEIEIEAKALLNETDYKKLVEAFPNAKSYYQTNHYIESPDRSLKKKGLSLRIREKEGYGFELTLKKELAEGRLEMNIPLSEYDFKDFSKRAVFPNTKIKMVLANEGVNIDRLRIIASLTTKRIDVPYEGGLLSIDMNEYNGVTDYEVELEHKSQEVADSLLEGLLSKHGITYKKNVVSKTRRALDTLKK